MNKRAVLLVVCLCLFIVFIWFWVKKLESHGPKAQHRQEDQILK